MNPAILVIMVTAPFLVCGELMTGLDYKELWKTQKHLDVTGSLMVCGALACFSLGCWLARFVGISTKGRGAPFQLPRHRLRMLFLAAAALTLFGYAIWSSLLFMQVGAGAILRLFSGGAGAASDIRGSESTISGVTTSTEFGMAAMILGTLILRRGRDQFVKFLMIVIFFLALGRAFIWSERLSVIEVMIPVIILYLNQAELEFSRRRQLLTRFAPLIGCVGLYFYFTVSEYFRSWSSFYQGSGMNLFGFAGLRIAGYYITALNNGYLLYKEQDVLPVPLFSLGWFWHFPGIESVLPYDRVTGVNIVDYDALLKEMANPEFNNQSGIFPYFVDFGVTAYLYWMVLGFLAGLLYRRFRKEQLSGLLFFPFLFIGLMVFSTITFLSTARAFPSWAFLIFSYCSLKLRTGTRRSRLGAVRRNEALYQAPSATGMRAP